MLTLEQISKRLETANIRALAREIGVHPNTIYGMQKGRNVSYEVVKKLSDYFLSLEQQ